MSDCTRCEGYLLNYFTCLALKDYSTATFCFIFQNVMTFNKCSMSGKAYGDVVDKYGNPLDITDVSTLKNKHAKNNTRVFPSENYNRKYI